MRLEMIKLLLQCTPLIVYCKETLSVVENCIRICEHYRMISLWTSQGIFQRLFYCPQLVSGPTTGIADLTT